MILTKNEIATVVTTLKKRARRSYSSHINLILFRLSTCCGLRVSEIVDLHRDDVRLDSEMPHIFVRNGKGNKQGVVPLWWDSATLADLREWKELHPHEHFIHTMSGGKMHKRTAQHRYKTCLRILGPEREKQLSIHKGRHAFISYALTEKPIAAVRDAARHSNIATTSRYAHAIDDGTVGNMFAA